MRVRPVSFDSLIDELTERLLGVAGRCRVALDGAAALDPGRYAEALVENLHIRGRFALHISVDNFLLPASQRFEFGRTSPESFYESWRDERGLQREVLDPAAPADHGGRPDTGSVTGSGPVIGSGAVSGSGVGVGVGAGPVTGSGRVLPALWRTDIDRSARAAYVRLPDDGIVVVSGQFLLGGGLTFDVSVHLECSAAALHRRTDLDHRWTLPAYDRYADEVAPASIADVVVRLEDPRRPAVVEPGDDLAAG